MKLNVWVNTGYVGSKRESTVEIDDIDFEGMDDYAKDVYVEECCQNQMYEMIEWGFEEIK